MLLWIIGTLGGLCPDLDSKNSISQRIGFLLACTVAAWILITILPNKMPLPLGLITIIGSVYALYYVFLPKLCRIMYHRGNCHSLATAMVLSLSFTNMTAYLLGYPSIDAFLVGLAFFSGFLSHLVLDEYYSIDFRHRRLKKSFGTAIKLVSLKTPASSIVLLVLCAGHIWILPPYQALSELLARITQATFGLAS